MTGYHIYYQSNDEGQYEEINHLILLSSIVNWKKNYGPIKLFCNKKYLESISKFGIDKEYDAIDTELIETVPYKEYMKRYWSFCKIHLAKHISNREDSFCILDTDLWIQAPNLLQSDCDLLFYHREAFNLSYEQNPYPLPENWIAKNDLNNFDWSIMPCNCAIIAFNKNCKDLINAWYNKSCEIIENTKDNDFLPNANADTIFIEQRLLPVLADKMQVKFDVLLPNIYLTFVPGNDASGKEWEPRLGHNEKSTFISANIKHIWGAKKYYAADWIRNLILKVTLSSIPEEYMFMYPELFETCISYINEN